MKQSSFDATISALDAETSALYVEMSAFGAATLAIARRSFDAISELGAETSALDVEMSAFGAAAVIRCDDIAARCGDDGDRSELPTISEQSFRRLRSWYKSADV